MKIKVAVFVALVASSIAMDLHAQVKQQPIPQIVKKDGRFALFVDGAPYLMLGAQVHNSSTWPATLPKVWPAMEFLNVNTVEAPISNRIRTLRFMNGEMSPAELGQRIGLTRQTIAAIEAGKYSPSLEAAFRIAQVFNVPLGEAFQWNAKATPLKAS